MVDIHLFLNSCIKQQNSEQKKRMEAYMRHQFRFLGIHTPLRKSLEKAAGLLDRKQTFDPQIVDTLLQKEEREYWYAAIDYLACHALDSEHAILDYARFFTKHSPWWDTIDAISKPLGKWIIHTKNYPYMLVFSKSDNLWQKRMSIIFQLGSKTKFDLAIAREVLTTILPNNAFFIQKAIAWLIRDYSRFDADNARLLLQSIQANLEPFALKSAQKFL